MSKHKFNLITKRNILNISLTKLVTLFMCLTILMYSLGCASIVSDSTYPVNINSDPDGAEISITDEEGITVFSGVTPTTVTLKTKKAYFKGKDYTVAFKKDGYNSHSVAISRKTDGWYAWGNILVGGLIGWLIVDPATGAMWKLEPDVSATLSSNTSSLSTEEKSINIVSLKDIPQDLRDKMIKIN